MPSDRYLKLQKVMQSRGCRRHIGRVADGFAGSAEDLARSEGATDVRIGREDGTRPKGRPYARVTVPSDQEFGTPNVERRAILRRSLP